MFNLAFLPWQISSIAHLNIYNLNIVYFSNQAYYVLIVSFHDKSNLNIFSANIIDSTIHSQFCLCFHNFHGQGHVGTLLQKHHQSNSK